MTKINQEEYEILKGLDDKWKWIAREEWEIGSGFDYDLWLFPSKPYKAERFWTTVNLDKSKQLETSKFQFIQWEDEEPYSIQELIDEYLDDEYGYFNMRLSREFEEFIKKESEETEVNKQKLIEKWESAIEDAEFYGKGKEDRLIEYMRDFVDDLNQLDEPEVLTQEEVDRAYKDGYEKGKEHATKVIKPTIPKLIAETIEEDKECGYDVYDSINLIIETNGGGLPSISNWVARNIDKYARAWLDGFTVEERELTVKGVIEEHIELLKKQAETVDLKPYYDLLEELKNG